ncbi:hypothetical protein EWP19_12965 [Acinetobacter piscicola]|nr:hypothetical protein EWP19_12965 [Acinetobacter piscicola]
MKLNIPNHPCTNKCTEFKNEPCNHCLIPSNSLELESTESDFLVGDVVVFKNQISTSYGDYVFPTGLFTVIALAKNSLAFKEVCGFFDICDIRQATVAELHANRRLTEAEHALAEVS